MQQCPAGRQDHHAWTGRKERTPEGDKLVSGDHKMANGLRFEDYDALRRQIANALLELAK